MGSSIRLGARLGSFLYEGAILSLGPEKGPLLRELFTYILFMSVLLVSIVSSMTSPWNTIFGGQGVKRSMLVLFHEEFGFFATWHLLG